MDEKVAAEARPLLRERPRRRQRSTFATVLALLAATALIAFFHRRPESRLDEIDHESEPEPWSWNDLEPSQDLKWETCYTKFECARLDVPMDWLDPSDKKRVVVGVIKLPAKSKDNPVSPVFVNPGGPGGSGVSFLKKSGPLLQKIVGDNHDIISFDPRGVGVSTPRVECWGSAQRRNLWTLQETPIVDERPGLIYDAYARASAYSGACEIAMEETGINAHLGTASIARDMLEILDKTGHEKLRYWGFSYGTILGGVFAGLFPERVERLVSDGNVEYHDWFNLDHGKFMSDADAIFDAFDKACHKVGPEACAFYAETPKAVQQRRINLLERLKASPVLIPAWSHPSGPDLPRLVTYSDVQRLTQRCIYSPLVKFPQLAKIYASLEGGDGGPFYDMLMASGGGALESSKMCSLGDTPSTSPLETAMELDAFPTIMCLDAAAVEKTPEEFEAYLKRVKSISRWAGAFNINFHLACVGRKTRPKWRFSEKDIKSDTAHPILFIGNMADNVTPLQSAFNNSARFPSSVVLKQNSYGHCSLAAPSTCTVRHIRKYFQDGTLPAAGSECDPDYDLFEMPAKGEEATSLDELTAAVLELVREVDIPKGIW
ncbi:Alpha/Beta hydrolase protein [Fusarium solani]|uniref:Alpha/Beta hydrolase protein n=1 Tax=Fusarium solani TaxID=169388 RepID=A0A9P9RCA9_FUSSL|nr:Alpha/Beta hydrolase protein [Fusarium solani]KAH7272815.1 Alpha/Beta hydrolase protein [Fusarium solani]